jgi:hypothetical protein
VPYTVLLWQVMDDSKAHIRKALQAVKESLAELGHTFPAAA